MFNPTSSQNLLNTPQLAKPKARDVNPERHSINDCGLFDMWLHPEQYRFNGKPDNHALDILA
jgi:hypothetical protein